MHKCFLGNDNSDSVGSLYDWGFGGEPGIQYRKVTYHDISNNEVYHYYSVFWITSYTFFYS